MQGSNVDYNDQTILSPFMNYGRTNHNIIMQQPHQELVHSNNPQEILRNKIRNDRLMMFQEWQVMQ